MASMVCFQQIMFSFTAQPSEIKESGRLNAIPEADDKWQEMLVHLDDKVRKLLMNGLQRFSTLSVIHFYG